MVDRVARAIGIVFGPPLIPLALAYLILAYAAEPVRTPDLVAFVVSLALMPALIVYGAHRAGLVDDLGVTSRDQRVMVATLSAMSGLIGVALLILIGAHAMLIALAAGIALQLLVLDLVTLRAKVSYHSAGAGGLAVAGFYLGGASLGLPLGAVALAIGWSRWHLGKHTVGQVAAGLATSFSVVLWLWVLAARLGL